MFKLYKPEFWQTYSFINTILFPFSFIYEIYTILRYHLSYPKSVKIPVICVGNLIVGGSGKTPIAICIAKHYLSRGIKIAFLSRGYGGSLSSSKNSIKIDSSLHTFQEVGDEALILASIAPTYIGINRYKSAQLAEKEGAEIIIMDDGMQNYTLYKDSTILVIDKEYGLGNQLCLPSGPLREPLYQGLEKADCMIFTGEGNFEILSSKKSFDANLNILNIDKFNDQSYLAVCSLGNPNKFISTLKNLNIKVKEKFIFPDHHAYTDSELSTIINLAKKLNVKIITTSKDFIKVPFPYQNEFIKLEIEYSLPDDFFAFLHGKIKGQSQ